MQTRVLGCVAGAVLSLAACNTVTRGVEETVTITVSLAAERQGPSALGYGVSVQGAALSPWVPGRSVPCQQW